MSAKVSSEGAVGLGSLAWVLTFVWHAGEPGGDAA